MAQLKDDLVATGRGNMMIKNDVHDCTVRVDGIDVHLRMRGQGGPDTVLLHGIPGSAATWDAVLSRLPDEGRVIVPDLVGFGDSSRTSDFDDLHAEGQARRLRVALRSVGVERAVLVGHDFGGPVAIRLLMQAPDLCAGLMLASTNVFTDTPIPFPLSMVNAPLIGGAVSRMLFCRAALRGMCRFGAKKGHVNSSMAVNDRAQSAAIRQIFAGSLTRMAELYAPIEEAIRACSVPVLVAWGDRDPFFPIAQATRTAEAIPGASVRVLRGCGHFLPDEQPDLLADAILELKAQVQVHDVNGAARETSEETMSTSRTAG